mmetsp:Transcript_43585/g.100446  ORF Transcript_43585/g.100446 Transcript_43585/m.100446 type:complete len:184 (-) Transcript_43585:336-887(-)
MITRLVRVLGVCASLIFVVDTARVDAQKDRLVSSDSDTQRNDSKLLLLFAGQAQAEPAKHEASLNVLGVNGASEWHVANASRQLDSNRSSPVNSSMVGEHELSSLCEGEEVVVCASCSQANCSRCYYIPDVLQPTAGVQCVASQLRTGCLSSKVGLGEEGHTTHHLHNEKLARDAVRSDSAGR